MLVRSRLNDTVLGTQRLTNQFGCAAQWALARVQADAAVAVDVVAVGEEPALLASGRDACRSDRERRANYRRRVRLHCTRHPRRWSARQPAAPAFEEPVSPSKVQANRIQDAIHSRHQHRRKRQVRIRRRIRRTELHPLRLRTRRVHRNRHAADRLRREYARFTGASYPGTSRL